ncbi:hypothetical protein GGP96_002054 [Salinibacter ruber]|uniref:hypothetical protein n=1 Tax=Salinibacter ruber TaxID=146919 RepID=UPI0021671799|nr:hypothetical protein [Salinibacter ruber]MCS4177329.1 hypothetical protein [Salinibacter ruber]
MIGLGTGYFFRLAEKTDQSIELLRTTMEEEREVVAHAIAIYELLRPRTRGSLDPAIVDLVLGHRPAFRWVETDTYDMLRPGAGISHGMGIRPDRGDSELPRERPERSEEVVLDWK